MSQNCHKIVTLAATGCQFAADDRINRSGNCDIESNMLRTKRSNPQHGNQCRPIIVFTGIMSGAKAAIFDFDFTLADSSRGIVDCVCCALGELGFAAPSEESIVQTIGLSLAETFRNLTGETDSELAKEFARHFHQRADLKMDSLTVIYDSVPSVMRSLRAVDLRTGIVTTKLHYRIKSILAANNLEDLFDVIVGADDVAKTKPDPEGLFLALQQLGGSATSAVYVGDHIVDAEAAEKAGIPFIAVLTGKHLRDAFDRYPHRAIVESIGDLPRILLS